MGYLSFIFLEAKFGAPTRISKANFGAKPPQPPNMEVPPGPTLLARNYCFHLKSGVNFLSIANDSETNNSVCQAMLASSSNACSDEHKTTKQKKD